MQIGSRSHSRGFENPSRPCFRALNEVHRGNDGFITLHREHNGKFENICAMPAASLPGLWTEEIQILLESDSYYSINSHYRYDKINAYQLKDENGEYLKLPARQGAKHLRHLTACYVDLDCYNAGIEVGDAIGNVIKAQDRGLIPNASIITRSGRGIWLYWLLQDANGGLQRGYPDKERLWSRIQFAIGERFGHLAADRNASDSSRIARIPGSRNSKSGSRVSYWVQYQENGQTPTYTLLELASFFGVAVSTSDRPSNAIQGPRDTYRSMLGAKGQRQRWENDHQAFWELVGLRVKIPIGARHHHLMVIGIIIGNKFRDPSEREREIIAAAEKLHPMMLGTSGDRLSLKEVIDKIRYNASKKTRRGNLSHRGIARFLKVTEEESIQLASILGRESWPADRVGPEAESATRSREAEARLRRDLLKRYADSVVGAKFPTLREWVAVLDARGLRASLATVRSDLQALGIQTGRERKVSESPVPRNHSLFDDPPG